MRARLENKKHKLQNPFAYQKCAHGRSKATCWANAKCHADRDAEFVVKRESLGNMFVVKQESGLNAQSRFEDVPMRELDTSFVVKREPGQAPKSRHKDTAATSVAGARAVRTATLSLLSSGSPARRKSRALGGA